MIKRIVGTMLVLGAMIGSAPASAGGGGFGGIVFDPTNFVQNAATAAQTLQQEILAVEQAIREVQMLSNSVKNSINSVTSLQGIRDLGAPLANLLAQADIDKKLLGQLGDQTKFVSNMINRYGASNSSTGSMLDYVSNIAKRAAAGEANAQGLVDNYSALATQVNTSIRRRADIAAKNSGSLGTNDAIQITNASLDNIAEINQATLSGISTLVREKAYESATNVAKTKAGEEQLSNGFTSILKACQSSGNCDSNGRAVTSSGPKTIMGY